MSTVSVICFSFVFAAVAYDKYQMGSESMPRTLLQRYFLGQRPDVSVELRNSKGRSVILVSFKKRLIIVGLLFSKNGRDG